MHTATIAPFARPLYVMAKPAGALCNLRCTYCYYLEKKHIYESHPNQVMSDEMLECYIKQYIESQTMGEVLFCWHGGEALMRPIAFYRRALQLQQTYARGRRISNSLQTNGLLLNDEWCEFFRENNFLIGLSLDGPSEFHDEYRRSASGKPSHHRVMEAVRMLDRHGVEWNALAVVNDYNVEYPLETYRFFRDNGCRFVQFTPIVERFVKRQDGLKLAPGLTDGGEVTDFSVDADAWGDFLCTVFDEWVRHDVGRMFVQIFDTTLANWMGVPPSMCSLSDSCGHAAALEWNGDLYSCDHFVYPEYRLGNIAEQPITGMMYSDRQREFGRRKTQGLTPQCRACEFRFACHGECPKNRFVNDDQGNPGHNYLCRGYKKFFAHVAPYMDYMKQLLNEQKPPALIMESKLVHSS